MLRWLNRIPATGYLLALGMVFLVLGALLLPMAWLHDRSLDQGGRVVNGSVLEKTSHRGQGTKSSNLKYFVKYRFAPAAGMEITGEAEVDPQAWAQAVVSDPIRVTYLPEDPEAHRVAGEYAQFRLWKLLVCLGGGLVPLYVRRLMLADGRRGMTPGGR